MKVFDIIFTGMACIMRQKIQPFKRFYYFRQHFLNPAEMTRDLISVTRFKDFDDLKTLIPPLQWLLNAPVRP